MKPQRLLAKSYDRTKYSEPPDYALLVQHSRDVAAACKALAQTTGAIALQNTGLFSTSFSKFERTLLANGWIQDLGKANSHFQEMVSHQNGLLQLLRHETISGILASLDEQFCEWLNPLGELKLIAIWGVMGHHRKFDDDTSPNQVPPLIVHLTEPDFKILLEEMAAGLSLDPPPVFTKDLVIARTKRDTCDLPARESLIELIDEFEQSAEELFQNEESRRFVALVKAFGIAADVAASAIAKQKKSAQLYSLSNSVAEALSIGLSLEDMEGLIQSWAKRAGLPKGFDPQKDALKFQQNVAASISLLTLAEAGCGSGKSLAAYLWAKQWCERLKAEGRTNVRLFFCLPTTGTTTEHFKDYALESGILESGKSVSLSHSRASVDLHTMAQTTDQEEAEEGDDTAKAARRVLSAEQDKIEALSLWSTPLVITTADTVLGLMANARRSVADTVLGLMANARRSVCSIPAIMQSVIVFDEIHAFDDYLFGHLLVFLKNFPHLPILLMTASLPEARRKAIERVRGDLNRIPGPPDREILLRYQIDYPINEDIAWERVEQGSVSLF